MKNCLSCDSGYILEYGHCIIGLDTAVASVSMLRNVRSDECLFYADSPSPSTSLYTATCDSSNVNNRWVHDERFGTIKPADNLLVCLEAIGTVQKFSNLGIDKCDSSDNQRFFYQWRDVDNGNVQISLLNHNFLVQASPDGRLFVNTRYSGSYTSQLWTEEDISIEYRYVCPFGIPVSDTTNVAGVENCESCGNGYAQDGTTCLQVDCTFDDILERLEGNTLDVSSCTD